MHRKLLIICILLCSCIPYGYGGRYTYDYNDNCNRIYQSFISLHMQAGRQTLLNEEKIHPYNLMATYLADYEDCIVLLLNCDKNEYSQRIDHLQERIDLLDKGDPSSPWFRFCKAGVYLHWAIAETRFGDQYKALMNFKRSYSLLKDNQELFPRFEYNAVFAGLEEAVVGALPGNYKWMASVFGIRGDVRKGTEKLGIFVNTHTDNQPLRSETILYYLYTRFYLLSEQQQVWDYLCSPQFVTKDNLLNTFVKVNIALDYRKADDALATLQQAASNPDYNGYPIFDYQQGVAMLTRLDSMSVSAFIHYITRTKSDIYIKDAWQKMAFAWYVNGNMTKADYCLKQVKTQGNTRLDADKQASRFAESDRWPLRPLLQARLLIDGGYYERALAILNQVPASALTNSADNAEYYFRMGRIYEETARGSNAAQNTKQALACYRSVMSIGKDCREQFAARAALQTAKIYERLSMKIEALSMYKECLDMPAHDFQNSIDQQAKAGINRLSGD